MSDLNEQGNLPGTPSVTPKSGWLTSQGQMTAIFAVICAIVSLFGISLTPETITSWIDRIESLAAVLLPLLAMIPVLMSYITSRGKIASNALKANADIKIAALTPPKPLIEGTPVGFLSADKLTGVIGGDDWKDPHRYENLLNLATAVGVPGAAQADKINRAIHPADLITGILGMLHKK